LGHSRCQLIVSCSSSFFVSVHVPVVLGNFGIGVTLANVFVTTDGAWLTVHLIDKVGGGWAEARDESWEEGSAGVWGRGSAGAWEEGSAEAWERLREEPWAEGCDGVGEEAWVDQIS